MISLISLCILLHLASICAQICDEEVTEKGISVTWYRSPPANNVLSDPLCYNNNHLITRKCENNHWTPPLPKLKPCMQVVKHYDLLQCPPGTEQISEYINEICYQISAKSAWDSPCLKSSEASLITDLGDEDLYTLLHSLRTKNISRYFWLPARRAKIFNPLRWSIPGSNWGFQVKPRNSLGVQTSFLKNCLLLDIDRKLIVTENCAEQYPSVCFYINKIHHPTKCPQKYYAFQFMIDNGLCFGIEQSDKPLPYDEFLSNKCSFPITEENNNDLNRFMFKKIAELYNLSDNDWCWFTPIKNTSCLNNTNTLGKDVKVSNNLELPECSPSQVIINKFGMLSLLNTNTTTKLPCMACVKKIMNENTELIFEYNAEEQLIYLTVYFPSGLWKLSNKYKGIQCFSDAEGFINVIEVNELSANDVGSARSDLEVIDKNVYIINPVTDRSAQYWCEGHTKNFSIISTDKLMVNPQGYKMHVFSLFVNFYVRKSDIDNLDAIMQQIRQNITSIFGAKEVVIMDIFEYSTNTLLILFHLHIEINNKYESDSRNVVNTYEYFVTIAKEDLIKYNYSFVNISSALVCLPTTSIDNLEILDWEMTFVGHIAVPSQFCLQANGLPVKRICTGSYLFGSLWGNVEGSCDRNYVVSRTTTFLYNFARDKLLADDMSRFLTVDLGTVLNAIDQIIPADIYYLSMSLKHILSIAQINHTLVEISSIDNIAWIMDRILSINYSYLHLSQTLNSTNAIVDSINELIEMVLYKNISVHSSFQTDCEVLSIQPKYIIQISCPKENNVSGIAIINSKSASNFEQMEIKALYPNSTIDEVLMIENLEVAAWLPNNVLNSLRKLNEDKATLDNKDVNIIITIFYNDAIFQELDNNHRVNSRLIGISIPGFILNFNHFVPLIFRDLLHSDLEHFCGYWDFELHKKKNFYGSWSRHGCFVDKSIGNMTICKCYHLTHFSHLLNIRNYKNDTHLNEKHTRTLNIITLVGSFFSLLGIACIWITACVFKSWRKKAGTKVLLNFSASIALPLIFIVFFNLDNTIFGKQNGVYAINDNMIAVCIILGALLHYSILASFMWMLITAVLQFIRYVRVLGIRRPTRFMLRLTIIGWGFPIIPVLMVLHISKQSYIPDVSNCYKCSICYPKGVFLILSVVVPICLVLFINIILFTVVLWSVIKGPDGKFRSTDWSLIKAQLRLFIFLFYLLGLTWIFGFLSFSKQLIWSYLFCLTSSLQGFVLFIYFIICDPNTRGLWVTMMKSQYHRRLSRKSISSISSG